MIVNSQKSKYRIMKSWKKLIKKLKNKALGKPNEVVKTNKKDHMDMITK